MKEVFWFFVNLVQTLFTAAWTGLWVTLALVVMILAWNRRLPLVMARRIWAPGLLWFARAKISVTGHENVDFTSPNVFVCNHTSTVDIPVVFAAIPSNLHFIIKKELLYAPFVGLFAWATRMIFVDRKATDRAFASLKRVGALIREGRSVIAFPEGTRNRGEGVLPFKKGVFIAAIESGVPVVPVALIGASEVMPPASWRIRPGTIRVVIGKPISTAGLTKDDYAVLPELARKKVAEAIS